MEQTENSEDQKVVEKKPKKKKENLEIYDFPVWKTRNGDLLKLLEDWKDGDGEVIEDGENYDDEVFVFFRMSEKTTDYEVGDVCPPELVYRAANNAAKEYEEATDEWDEYISAICDDIDNMEPPV